MTPAELEARRLELAEEWNDNNIFEDGQTLASWTKDAYKAGFDSCAALLQGEMDKYSESMRFYMSELQSANAKLAVANKDTERLEWMIENGHFNPLKVIGLKWIAETPYLCTERFETPREAIDAALDASEGKGKE
jgi:hypothetical protein